MSVYCLISLEDYKEEGLRFVTSHIPSLGSETHEDFTKAMRFTTLKDAQDAHMSIVLLDRHFWPPVLPLIGIINSVENKLCGIESSNLSNEGLAHFTELLQAENLPFINEGEQDDAV